MGHSSVSSLVLGMYRNALLHDRIRFLQEPVQIIPVHLGLDGRQVEIFTTFREDFIEAMDHGTLARNCALHRLIRMAQVRDPPQDARIKRVHEQVIEMILEILVLPFHVHQVVLVFLDPDVDGMLPSVGYGRWDKFCNIIDKIWEEILPSELEDMGFSRSTRSGCRHYQYGSFENNWSWASMIAFFLASWKKRRPCHRGRLTGAMVVGPANVRAALPLVIRPTTTLPQNLLNSLGTSNAFKGYPGVRSPILDLSPVPYIKMIVRTVLILVPRILGTPLSIIFKRTGIRNGHVDLGNRRGVGFG